MPKFDYIVAGSGITGAHAAQTLIESGAKVLMLDVGFKEEKYNKLVPDNNFVSIRETDDKQHRYFLGDNFEGVYWDRLKVGAQLTPSRKHIVKDIDKWLRLDSEDFEPMESLAYGGLGSGWGAGCYVYSQKELDAIGLEYDEMLPAYNIVADRIQVSSGRGEYVRYNTKGLKDTQQPLKPEKSISEMINAFERKKDIFNKKGFFIGQPGLAILTKDFGSRKAIAYKDMDFWADHDRSIYRPWMTVDKLQGNPNFLYQDRRLVISFEETDRNVRVKTIEIDSNRTEFFECKRLILCAGVLGSARIVLRSFNSHGIKLPLISNPYVYVPCIHLRRLGKEIERYKTSLGVLDLYYDKNFDNFDVAQASFFTYRSLLLFKLMKEVPLNFADGLQLMRYLLSAFIIAGIHHPDHYGKEKYIELVKSPDSLTGDKLKAVYRLSEQEKKINKATEKKILKAFRKMGLFPIKKIPQKHGSSIHYGGTIPFSNKDELFTQSKNGRLHGTKNVYLADSSGFKYMPAKGVSLTQMANAHRVAKNAINEKS